MIKPARRETLHDNILAQLMDAIRSGKWEPGSKIPGEQELARQFEVSRNCIREVLKALRLSGVVEAYPGQGTFLTRNALQKLDGGSFATTVLGDASLWELMEVRQLLEGQVAYLVAARATDEEIATLKSALQTREPEKTYQKSDFRFHTMLAALAGNTLLTGLLAQIQSRMDELRARYAKMPGGVMGVFDQEHKSIYEAIASRRPEEARQAMEGHIRDAWVDILYRELQSAPGERKKSIRGRTSSH